MVNGLICMMSGKLNVKNVINVPKLPCNVRM